MKISKTQLPEHSILNNLKYDYADSFQGELKDIYDNVTPSEMGKAFFLSAPKWVEYLLNFRNKIVSVFGLKTSGSSINKLTQIDNFKGEPGERMGLFMVFNKTENELVLGEDDKHLNFRVSLLIGPGQQHCSSKSITISTTVKFNNWFGKLYFLPVRPFHKLIVPIMLKGTIQQLEMKLIRTDYE